MIAAYVAGRTREIGVRMALGAGASMVLRMIFGQLAATAGIGVAAGLAGSWAATRVIESRLFGVKAHDPFTFVLVAAGVLLIAAGSGFVPGSPRPAHRPGPCFALRVDSVSATERDTRAGTSSNDTGH